MSVERAIPAVPATRVAVSFASIRSSVARVASESVCRPFHRLSASARALLALIVYGTGLSRRASPPRDAIALRCSGASAANPRGGRRASLTHRACARARTPIGQRVSRSRFRVSVCCAAIERAVHTTNGVCTKRLARAASTTHVATMVKRSVGSPSIAVGYVRASTDRQELGPEAQRDELARWAERERVTLAAVHEDSVSGGAELEDRPGLLAAIDAAKRSGAGLLVVTRRDRLARDVAIAALIEREVARVGARVVTTDGVASGQGAAEIFQRSIMDAVAQFERALIRERTRAALRAKRARGERTGGVPWGYRAGEGGRLEIEPSEREIADRVRELRARGRPLRAIVRALDEEGVRARSGRRLGLTQVARMVRRL